MNDKNGFVAGATEEIVSIQFMRPDSDAMVMVLTKELVNILSNTNK